ncbi:M20/M25/M40 family metallo-hydrolase [Actomonas aquatica]|uniref:Carboxypeptidase Q n=1 Tax=Actomonas aquatica TaxID=2866162 RepID=A0ABZ1CA30_9BACT|nr:M20/M25/M40 family metallo-hydrolase [Opitutus sp. WL0086]WRQ87444.1 M20/M25/M40 family metallo-hydrolase [Opitutus sp. WL0086]
MVAATHHIMRFDRRLLAVPTALLALAFANQTVAADPPELDPQLRQQAETLIAAALESELAYNLVESLTTEVGPRLAGSAAEARARDWATAKLTDLGFSHVRVEPFEIEGWERHAESAAITAPFPQALTVTALGNSVPTPAEGLTGTVARFDSLDALLASDDAPEALAGRIVFVDETMTRTQDGSGYGNAVRKRYQAATAGQARGAIAALIRSVGTSHHRFAHTGSMGYGDVGHSIPTAALAAPDADQLTRALQRGDVSVRLKLHTEILGPMPSGNVIAEIPGRTHPEEIVLLGAHLDSWDLAPGAIDDGAGVAIVTAAARLLLEHDLQPRRTVRIVLFGAEEVGLRGGRAYAAAHAATLPQHVAAAESDFGADIIWRLDTNLPPERTYWGEHLYTLLKPLGVGRGTNETTGGPDIGPLVPGGATPFALRQNGWDYFDYHHTPNDTLDKIDPVKLRQNVAAYVAFAWLMANID